MPDPTKPGEQDGVQTFEAVVRPHLERLYRFAYRLCGSRPDAEDLVQSLLVKLYPQASRLSGLDQPGPWLARSLYHLYVDEVRRRSRTPLDLTPPEDGGETALEQFEDPRGSPENQAEHQLTRERLQAAVAQLPDEQRALIAWHDIEGYTLEELAESRDIPLGTLKSRLHRARARLRQILMEPFTGPGRVQG